MQSPFKMTSFLHFQLTALWTFLVTRLEIRHVFVALLRARVIRQLNVPEAGQLMDQERILFDDSVEDVLQTQYYIIIVHNSPK